MKGKSKAAKELMRRYGINLHMHGTPPPQVPKQEAIDYLISMYGSFLSREQAEGSYNELPTIYKTN